MKRPVGVLEFLVEHSSLFLDQDGGIKNDPLEKSHPTDYCCVNISLYNLFEVVFLPPPQYLLNKKMSKLSE